MTRVSEKRKVILVEIDEIHVDQGDRVAALDDHNVGAVLGACRNDLIEGFEQILVELDDVLGTGSRDEIDDKVLAKMETEYERVVITTSGQRVIAAAPVDYVITSVSTDRITAPAAFGPVIARIAAQHICKIIADQNVVVNAPTDVFDLADPVALGLAALADGLRAVLPKPHGHACVAVAIIQVIE